MYSYDQVCVMLEMIEDESVDKEVKLLYIIDSLASGYISHEKARELLYENGFISEPWVVIDAKSVEEFGRRYEEKYINKS